MKNFTLRFSLEKISQPAMTYTYIFLLDGCPLVQNNVYNDRAALLLGFEEIMK